MMPSRKRKSSRRSSILKATSPVRDILGEVDPNSDEDMNRRKSRRVSFAPTYTVKEFIKDSPKPPVQNLQGLDSLLTGQINDAALTDGNATQHGDISMEMTQVVTSSPSRPLDKTDTTGLGDPSPIQKLDTQSLLRRFAADSSVGGNVNPKNLQLYMPDRLYSQDDTKQMQTQGSDDMEMTACLNATALTKQTFFDFIGQDEQNENPLAIFESPEAKAVNDAPKLNSLSLLSKLQASTDSCGKLDTQGFLSKLSGNSDPISSESTAAESQSLLSKLSGKVQTNSLLTKLGSGKVKTRGLLTKLSNETMIETGDEGSMEMTQCISNMTSTNILLPQQPKLSFEKTFLFHNDSSDCDMSITMCHPPINASTMNFNKTLHEETANQSSKALPKLDTKSLLSKLSTGWTSNKLSDDGQANTTSGRGIAATESKLDTHSFLSKLTAGKSSVNIPVLEETKIHGADDDSAIMEMTDIHNTSSVDLSWPVVASPVTTRNEIARTSDDTSSAISAQVSTDTQSNRVTQPNTTTQPPTQDNSLTTGVQPTKQSHIDHYSHTQANTEQSMVEGHSRMGSDTDLDMDLTHNSEKNMDIGRRRVSFAPILAATLNVSCASSVSEKPDINETVNILPHELLQPTFMGDANKTRVFSTANDMDMTTCVTSRTDQSVSYTASNQTMHFQSSHSMELTMAMERTVCFAESENTNEIVGMSSSTDKTMCFSSENDMEVTRCVTAVIEEKTHRHSDPSVFYSTAANTADFLANEYIPSSETIYECAESAPILPKPSSSLANKTVVFPACDMEKTKCIASEQADTELPTANTTPENTVCFSAENNMEMTGCIPANDNDMVMAGFVPANENNMVMRGFVPANENDKVMTGLVPANDITLMDDESQSMDCVKLLSNKTLCAPSEMEMTCLPNKTISVSSEMDIPGLQNKTVCATSDMEMTFLPNKTVCATAEMEMTFLPNKTVCATAEMEMTYLPNKTVCAASEMELTGLPNKSLSTTSEMEMEMPNLSNKTLCVPSEMEMTAMPNKTIHIAPEKNAMSTYTASSAEESCVVNTDTATDIAAAPDLHGIDMHTEVPDVTLAVEESSDGQYVEVEHHEDSSQHTAGLGEDTMRETPAKDSGKLRRRSALTENLFKMLQQLKQGSPASQPKSPAVMEAEGDILASEPVTTGARLDKDIMDISIDLVDITEENLANKLKKTPSVSEEQGAVPFKERGPHLMDVGSHMMESVCEPDSHIANTLLSKQTDAAGDGLSDTISSKHTNMRSASQLSDSMLSLKQTGLSQTADSTLSSKHTSSSSVSHVSDCASKPTCAFSFSAIDSSQMFRDLDEVKSLEDFLACLGIPLTSIDTGPRGASIAAIPACNIESLYDKIKIVFAVEPELHVVEQFTEKLQSLHEQLNEELRSKEAQMIPSLLEKTKDEKEKKKLKGLITGWQKVCQENARCEMKHVRLELAEQVRDTLERQHSKLEAYLAQVHTLRPKLPLTSHELKEEQIHLQEQIEKLTALQKAKEQLEQLEVELASKSERNMGLDRAVEQLMAESQSASTSCQAASKLKNKLTLMKKLEEFGDRGAVFGWLDNAVQLHLRFGDPVAGYPTHRHIASSEITSTLAPTAKCSARLAANIMLKSSVLKQGSWSTTRQLPKLLDKVSEVESYARYMQRDVAAVEWCNHISMPTDTGLCLMVSNCDTISKVRVMVRFDPAHLDKQPQVTVQPLFGNIRSEELLSELSAVRQGPAYIKTVTGITHAHLSKCPHISVQPGNSDR